MAKEHSFSHEGRQYGFRFGLNPMRNYCTERGIELADLEKTPFTFDDVLQFVWHAHVYWHTKKAVTQAESLDVLIDIMEDTDNLEKVFTLFKESRVVQDDGKKKQLGQKGMQPNGM